jgi:putative hemolysin
MEKINMKRLLITSMILCILITLTACSAPRTQPVVAPVSTDLPQANMPNPASVYCEQQGNKLEIRTAADGSQSGYCIFPDGSECDEWAYFRGECGPSVLPPTPKFVQSPLAIQPANVPIPYAVLVNTGDKRGITAYDRSGLVLGEWQTAPMTGKVHAAGIIADGVMSTPLVFWDYDSEKPGLRLNLNLGGNITQLLELADSDAVTFTEMIGVPTSPMIAYSTLQYEENGALIRSKIYLSEYQSLASASPILVMDSRESKYITPFAIRLENQKPIGIWFTYHLFGIGGTPALFTNNSGLYYFDIPSNTIYEFLAADKAFNNLSINQAYATWVQANSGDMQVTDLISGQTVSFSKRPESERSAGFGLVSPSGGYVAWEEGVNLIPGEEAPIFTVRIGTMDGNILAEYPHINFAKTSELGVDTSISLLGWLSDETLLVGVDQHGKEGEEAIVAVNVNANEVTLFARGEFAGFAYP